LIDVVALSGEEALYADLNDTLAVRDHPVLWLPIRGEFMAGVEDADSEVSQMMAWNQNGVTAGNGWYAPTNPANWSAVDFQERTAIAKSNMFENRVEETKYFFTDTETANDGTAGPLLNGSLVYEIAFAESLKDHANKAFWSITVYDENHMFNTTNTNTINRYSLGSNEEGFFVKDPDGSFKLYAGPTAPQGMENQWIPTPEGEPFSLYIRAYWPDENVRNGQWKPPVVSRVG
jgi:hypothetical protein